MKPAFSTIACPDWTLPRIAERADTWGYLGVEFRTFGEGSTPIACDPALSAAPKVRALFDRAGVRILSLATSVRLDEPVTPPVVGHLFNTELAVKAACSAVDLAVQLECPFVRVFGFDIITSEPRRAVVARIASRLEMIADHCRNSGVGVLLENGGSFCTATELSEVLDAVRSPLVSAAYNLAVARAAGESVAQGVNVLGDRLSVCKVRDLKGARPCALGAGDWHCEADLRAVARAGFTGWVVHEHDRLWSPGATEPERVLADGARKLYEWCGPASPAGVAR